MHLVGDWLTEGMKWPLTPLKKGSNSWSALHLPGHRATGAKMPGAVSENVRRYMQQDNTVAIPPTMNANTALILPSSKPSWKQPSRGWQILSPSMKTARWWMTDTVFGLTYEDNATGKLSAWITGGYSLSHHSHPEIIYQSFPHHFLCSHPTENRRPKNIWNKRTPRHSNSASIVSRHSCLSLNSRTSPLEPGVNQKTWSPVFLRCQISGCPNMPMRFFIQPMTLGGSWETSTGHSGHKHQKQ